MNLMEEICEMISEDRCKKLPSYNNCFDCAQLYLSGTRCRKTDRLASSIVLRVTRKVVEDCGTSDVQLPLGIEEVKEDD